MSVPAWQHHVPADLRLAGVPAAGVLLAAMALLGCAQSSPPAISASPTVLVPTQSPLPSVQAGASPSTSASPSTAVSTTFGWAARPDSFAGDAGASLVQVAAGPTGLVALSAHDHSDGTRTRRLWGSRDGMIWLPLDLNGLPDQSAIDGIWGAGGSYWLAGRGAPTDNHGNLWRSSDWRTWRQSLELDQDLIVFSIGGGCDESNAPAGGDCPLFLTGTIGVDGTIWRSTDGGGTWARATVEDATGWKGTQDAAAVEIRGVVALSDGLLAFGDGLPSASDTSGFVRSRFWRSDDGGVTWSRIPNAAPIGELFVRGVAVNGGVVVAVGERAIGRSGIASAVLSTDGGRTWSRARTSGDEADGDVSHVLAKGSGFIGLGFASPAAVDTFPVREFLWTSDDGAAWRTVPAGDLDGGIVDDVVWFNDQIVAVGRGWTTAETGTWEAPFGPAVWTIVP